MKFPLVLYKVEGNSMVPKLKKGSYVLVRRTTNVHPGDIIVCQVNGRILIKLFSHIQEGKIFIVGLNLNESTDSRHFGPISRDEVLGKVIFVI